ncbi:hypothetical protein [Streptosporangium sp. V21-05]|uniref:hypothetical protein n=1 Tax=Streptosporangium sp. V21-05 TaxID=3446115 RepID=UPI003F52BED7
MRIGKIFVAVLFITPTLAPATAAIADVNDDNVKTIVIEGHNPGLSTKLVITLDGAGVSPSEAEEIRESLSGESVNAVPLAAGMPIYCGGEYSHWDSNGTFTIGYQCLSSKRSLPWGYVIDPQLQWVIVSNVTENGMYWWKNNVSMPKNASHVVPKDYHFHGNFNPVAKGNNIHYNDYMTFRVNIPGSGTGTASLTVVGDVTLKD